MQLYELLFIIVPSVADDQVQKTIDAVLATIKKEAPELDVKAQKALGRRKFTYPIKHLAEGVYVLVDFEADTAHLQDINRVLELEDILLRHIIVKKEIKSEKQIEKEAKLKAEMQQARAGEIRKDAPKSQQKLVQKADELGTKKGKDSAPDEKLEEKLDEILKREIT